MSRLVVVDRQDSRHNLFGNRYEIDRTTVDVEFLVSEGLIHCSSFLERLHSDAGTDADAGHRIRRGTHRERFAI